MTLRTKNFGGIGVLSLLLLAGCGDDKAPSSKTAATQTAPPANEAPCSHEAAVSEPKKTTKPAPRSPVESYARKVNSGNMRKHLSGVGVLQEKAAPPPSESSDDCKARVAARYQECLETAKENDPASKRRCDIFRQWFRDRCQSSGGGASGASAPPKVSPDERAPPEEKIK